MTTRMAVPSGMAHRESESARKRRQDHETELDRVGVGSPEGQDLLEKWHREDMAARRGGKDGPE